MEGTFSVNPDFSRIDHDEDIVLKFKKTAFAFDSLIIDMGRRILDLTEQDEKPPGSDFHSKYFLKRSALTVIRIKLIPRRASISGQRRSSPLPLSMIPRTIRPI